MKAIVKYALGKEGFGLMDIPEPSPKEGELKVKVIAAGICGGDIHAINDERGAIMPVALGHEFVGTVVETCGDVGKFKVGDYVCTLPACYSCGHCEFCKAGMVTLCPERKSIGTHRNGAMAEYVIVPAKYSFVVPHDVKDIYEFAMAEPFCCAVRGVYHRINVKPGDVALVSGPGTIGQVAMQALKTRGARVIASGLKADAHRLKLALDIGAADMIVDNEDDLKVAMAKMGRPAGVNIAVECAGHPSSLNVCMRAVGVKGTVLTLGYHGGHDISFCYDLSHIKELDMFGSNSTAMEDWDVGLKLMIEGKVNLSPLATMKLPLADWKKGFDAFIKKEAYKVLFCPELDK